MGLREERGPGIPEAASLGEEVNENKCHPQEDSQASGKRHITFFLRMSRLWHSIWDKGSLQGTWLFFPPTMLVSGIELRPSDLVANVFICRVILRVLLLSPSVPIFHMQAFLTSECDCASSTLWLPWGQNLGKYLNGGRSELVGKCFVAGVGAWE